jgi:hypothetical protein
VLDVRKYGVQALMLGSELNFLLNFCAHGAQIMFVMLCTNLQMAVNINYN